MDDVRQYRAQLKKLLPCLGSTRERLLETFDKPLNSYLEEHPQADMEELSAAFGTPQEMAAVLAEGLSREESAKYQMKLFWLRLTAAILAAALLLFSGYVLFIKQKPLESEGKVEVINVVETPPNTITGG